MLICTSCRKLLKADAGRCPVDGAAVEIVETLPKDARLGAYRIDRVLGEGGMGFVYEATHEVLNRRTAIKMLRPELAVHTQIVTRFLNEAKAVNLIDHQNIVNVYDYGDNQDGSVYFVMEYLEGETLDDLMRKRQPMSVPLLLHLFGQVAKALAAAHAKQIVHRDLKPANVYVVPREDNPFFVKLLDFGIAQLRGAGAVQGLTMAGQVMGTPQYMSPEQISGGTVDARTDVWALGVMMYRAATGQAPFKGEEFAELADKILHHVPPPAGQLVALPASLSALITSCLELRLDARCPSIAAVIEGLDRVKHELRLDDDQLLDAVVAEAGVLGENLPAGKRAYTRNSIAASDPRYQVAPGLLERGVNVARPSRLGAFVVLGVVLAGLGGGAYAMFGRTKAIEVGPTNGSSGPGPDVVQVKPPPTLEQLILAGDLAEAHKRAAQDLLAAIEHGSLQDQGFAVDALGMARVKQGAPLLYQALKASSPDVLVKAAHALADLGLPDAAPKLRAALSGAGGKVSVELAAALFRLGDKDARAALLRALEDPGQRLIAAAALADAADDGGRAVLIDLIETMPHEREAWRRAAGALLKLGDANARKLLEAELAQPEPLRSVGAAALLARARDANARDQLVRAVADPDFTRRGEAALALARLGDRRAADWIPDGSASGDAEQRAFAAAICGLLGADAAAHTKALAAATNDKVPSVRMSAEAAVLGL